MGGQRNGRQDERTVIHRPVIRQAGRGEERDARGDGGGKDENGVSPRLTTSKTRRGAERWQRNEDDGNGASKRIHMRQVIDNIDKRLLKTFSSFYLRV